MRHSRGASVQSASVGSSLMKNVFCSKIGAITVSPSRMVLRASRAAMATVPSRSANRPYQSRSMPDMYILERAGGTALSPGTADGADYIASRVRGGDDVMLPTQLKAACSANALVGGADLMGAFRRHLHHFFRQSLRHQFVRMVLAEQASIGFLDLLRARAGIDIQQRIGIGERTPGLRCLAAARTKFMRNANHVLQSLELARRKAQLRAHPQQQLALRRVHYSVGVRRLNQQLQEHAQQIATPQAFTFELRQHVVQRKIAALAFVEQAHRRLLQRGIETEARHHSPGDIDLVDAHPAVGLGDVAHHRKQRREKSRLDALLFVRIVAVGKVEMIVVGLAVETVTECRADQRAERAAQHKSHDAAERLTQPSHTNLRYLRGQPPRHHYRSTSPRQNDEHDTTRKRYRYQAVHDGARVIRSLLFMLTHAAIKSPLCCRDTSASRR